MKKENIIADLIKEKIEMEQVLNEREVFEKGDVDKLRSQIKGLELEKEELLKFTSGGTKNVDFFFILGFICSC